MIRDVKTEHGSLLYNYENYGYGPMRKTTVEKWYPSNWLEITMLLSNGTISKYQLLNSMVSYPSLDGKDILDMTEEEWREKYYRVINLRRYYVGMVQEDLAKSTDISLTSVNKYFTRTSTPSLYNATKLARTMKASLSEFQICNLVRLDFDEVNGELEDAINDIDELYPEIVEDLRCWYPLINQREIMLIMHDGAMFIFNMDRKTVTLQVYKPGQDEQYISPTEWSDRFSKILRDKMYECDITQTRLSNLIDVSQPIVSRYKNGDAIPSLYIATKMARVFECSLTDFHIQP